MIARLDAGPVTLGELVEATATRPLRLYKFLDGLEGIGLVVREQPTDELLAARYVSREPLAAAVEAVLGERSIERDRDKYPWREIYGRLGDVLSGRLDARFAWPPRDDEEVRAFEASMAAGCAPIVEALREARDAVFDSASKHCSPETEPLGSVTRRHWLDVGGGDGGLHDQAHLKPRSLAGPGPPADLSCRSPR